MIPDNIPQALRNNAIPISDGGETHMAWSKPDARAVLDALDGTTVAVVGVQTYASGPTGPLPTDDAWSCEPMVGDTATGFAERSRSGARDFLAGLDDNDLFALEFSFQDDAA